MTENKEWKTPVLSNLSAEWAAKKLAEQHAEITMLRALVDETVRERENYNGLHQLACMEIERLRQALQEITVRTYPYSGRHEEWPLVAGIDAVANAALTSQNLGND